MAGGVVLDDPSFFLRSHRWSNSLFGREPSLFRVPSTKTSGLNVAKFADGCTSVDYNQMGNNPWLVKPPPAHQGAVEQLIEFLKCHVSVHLPH